jgi:hypothetical protein
MFLAKRRQICIKLNGITAHITEHPSYDGNIYYIQQKIGRISLRGLTHTQHRR